MGQGRLVSCLLAVCLGAPLLDGQVLTQPAGAAANASSLARRSYAGRWQGMHRRSARLRAHPFARPHATADDDADATPNFAGFYTAPFIRDVAPLSAGANRIAFLTVDVNHDGHPDLLSIDSNGGIAAAINDGSGHFATPTITAPTASTTNTVDAIASDVNGDGYPDVVVLTGGVPAVNRLGPQQFIVLTNQKDGTFKATATLSPVNNAGLEASWSLSYPPITWTVGTTSATGLPDIVAEYLVIAAGSISATFTRSVFPNDGSGGFSDATQSTATVPLSGVYSSPYSFLTTTRLLLADVNHDGKPDLLTAYVLPLAGPFQVDIALGNGNGTFAAPLSNTAISVPYDSSIQDETNFALASLSGSTSPAPDLLLSGDNSVFLAASNGDGTYKTPVLITQESFKRSGSIAGFHVADVSGDGLPDLLVIGHGSLTTLLGKGNGSFDPAIGTVVTNSGDTYNTGVVFADFDGDGKLDCITDSSDSPDVVMSKGVGDGNFGGSPFFDTSAASIPSGNFGVIAVLDLNGDGKTDLLGINLLNGDKYAVIATASGRFTFKPTLSQISLNTFIESYTADFNGDGKSDLVVEQTIDGTAPSYISTNKVGVALSNGDGSFQDPVYATLPAAISAELPFGIAAGDLNGDGKVDLVLAYMSQGTTGQEPGGYCVALGKGDGSFTPATFTAFGASPTDVLLEHFHGSKAPLDMVIGDTGQRMFETPQVSILKGNGDGTFGLATTIVSGQNTSGLLSGDFNKDGSPDLIVPINYAYGPPDYMQNFDQDGLAFYMGHGDGSFSAPTTVAPGSNPYYPITADVNGDGNLDILYDSAGAGVDDGLTVLLSHGDGTFAAAIRYPMPLESYLAAGNFLADNAQSLIADIPGSGAALVMNLGGTSMALTSDGSAISAKVTPSLDNRPIPTGTGTFLDGSTVLGTNALSNGTSSIETSGLAPGTHAITFEYTGDANFQPNRVSSTISVTAPPAPDFTISSGQNSLTLSAGQSGTLKVAIAANAGLSGAVTFACTGLPAESACSFSPASLTAAPGQSSVTTLTITTTAPTSALARRPIWMTIGKTATALAFLLVVPIFSGRRQRLWMAMGLMAVGISSLTGCGGTSSSPSNPPNTGSPVGSYSVAVTATSMQVSHTLPIKVVIQ